MEGVSLEKWI